MHHAELANQSGKLTQDKCTCVGALSGPLFRPYIHLGIPPLHSSLLFCINMHESNGRVQLGLPNLRIYRRTRPPRIRVRAFWVLAVSCFFCMHVDWSSHQLYVMCASPVFHFGSSFFFLLSWTKGMVTSGNSTTCFMKSGKRSSMKAVAEDEPHRRMMNSVATVWTVYLTSSKRFFLGVEVWRGSR
jgi:hypothetical protein